MPTPEPDSLTTAPIHRVSHKTLKPKPESGSVSPVRESTPGLEGESIDRSSEAHLGYARAIHEF
jgi:hypothetical protein